MKNLAWLLLALSLVGCGDNLAAPDGRTHGGGGDGDDGPPNPFTTLAMFNPMSGELAEGLTSFNGTVYVGLAPIGKVVKIGGGMGQAFGMLPGTVSNTYTLGLAANAAGDIFVGVGASGASPTPAPGVYRIPAAGGTATVFSTTAAMTFPNALDFDASGKLYVTDSASGTIFEISAQGNASVWLQSPMLAGDTTACGGGGPGFPIGANGIVHDAMNRYVAVTDFGRVVRIPIRSNGMPGTPAVLAESCEKLKGIDGIALEASGSIVAALNGPLNSIVRISADGQTVTTLHKDAPLDGPASVIIITGTTTQLVVTNSAFFSGMTGRPSVLSLKL